MEKGKKYIHCCWFGGKKMPRFAKRCIRSWKKYLPDYEVIYWNESNVDLHECPFVEEAYEKKKWAFVADYVRTKALYEYGGIYLDTDVMIKKDINFLLDKSFVGIEDSGYVNAAVWGAKKPKSFLPAKVLEFYKSQPHFSDVDLYSITIPVVITSILSRYGFNKASNDIQIVKDTYIYPREYFYPLSYDHENNVFTDNTCMIHYSEASWTSKAEKRDIRLIRIFGRKRAGIILKVLEKAKALLIYYWKVIWRTVLLLALPIRWLYRQINKKNIDTFSGAVKKIEENRRDYIAFTHVGWIGVESSTKELFGQTISIDDVNMTDDLEKIAAAIYDNKNIKIVVFSAFGKGWEYLARKIKEKNPEVVIKIFWHGSNAMHVEGFDWERFRVIFTLLDQGVVSSIAFAKKSMYEQYKKLGYNVEFLPNTVRLGKMKKEIMSKKRGHNGTRIGIYASGDRWVKNLYNQMAAVSLVKNSVLDMIPLSSNSIQFAKILKISLVGEEKNVKRKQLLERIVNDDIVLYATFVECAPVMPLECLELGVLCVTGDNHHYWTGTPLEKYLVESKVDNPIAIADRIEKCLKNKEKILNLYEEWKKNYDKYCDEELRKFLDIGNEG